MSPIESTPAVPEFRLPVEPYPGLRPFLDHESSLLFGRARQVREIIEHLRTTQFVAVIGGSGSGKSSLIHAGVVPELRSFGIRGAGDFWIPMVCTPGTNAETAVPGRPRSTPITRLAWKFARLLKSRGSEAADAERVEEIAAWFRQDAGFARLVDTYAKELAVPPGPDPTDARLLFVIDQFEELFHPTNMGSDDARMLVERVIDHFFNPHERCYVVLTMRSEHLNDCASFLELPDAINKSSYLVRRLDEAELREAIEAPAQRFLRLLQRQGSQFPGPVSVAALPAEVVFDEKVLQLLLRDAKSITHDPDHLPLLQHLLARMWEMARQRENVSVGGAPANIELIDLRRAVAAVNEGDPALDETLNVLRASLENWAEAIFRPRGKAQQKRIESLLRHLAFKDPNTGMYSQQRVNVEDPRLFEDDPEPSTPVALRALIEDPQQGRHGQFGYIGSVDYLFWDDENSQRVTLKVSHESFIRGWSRFRLLIDKDAERFETFVDLLRRCARWLAAKRPDDLLLGAPDLDHLGDERLHAVLGDPQERASWFKVLRLDRDGPRLAPCEVEIDAFIKLSRERQAAEEKARLDAAEREREAEERARMAMERSRELERQGVEQVRAFEAERREAEADRLRVEAEKDLFRAETRRAEAETDRAEAVGKRNFWLGVTAVIVAFVLMPYAAFAIFIQAPVMQSVEKFAGARALVDRRDRAETNPVAGAAGHELGILLRAVALVDEAKTRVAFLDRRWMRVAAEWLPPLDNTKRLFAATSSEPLVNGSLRSLLTAAMWRSDTDPAKVDEALKDKPVRHELSCAVITPDGSPRTEQGSLFFDAEAERGLFVPRLGAADAEISVYAAAYSGKACEAGRVVWSVPRYLQPLLLLDARARHMAVALTGPAVDKPSVSLYAINWESGVDGRAPGAQVKFRSVVTDSGAVELIRREIDLPQSKDAMVLEVKSVGAWREPGGIGVAVSGTSWRLFTERAQRIADPGPASSWPLLQEPVPGSACASLGATLERKVQPGFMSKMYQEGGHCFEIQRGNPLPTGQAAAPSGPASAPSEPGAPREQVLMSVYEEPRPEVLAQLDTALPTPIASLVAFNRLATGPGAWVIGTAGSHEGWIALRCPNAQGGQYYTGAPWSTSALGRLGQEVVQLSTGPLKLPAQELAKPTARKPAASAAVRR